MDIIKIIGIGLTSLIIIVIVKQYRPEFVLYVSLAAGILILVMIMEILMIQRPNKKGKFFFWG